MEELRKKIEPGNEHVIDGVSLIIGGIISISVVENFAGDYLGRSGEARQLAQILSFGVGIACIIFGIFQLAKSRENDKPKKIEGSNTVLNIPLSSGIIAAIVISPQRVLNRKISPYTRAGWKVIQILPAQSGNLLLLLFRLLLLLITCGFYTTANGFYIVLERQKEALQEKSLDFLNSNDSNSAN